MIERIGGGRQPDVQDRLLVEVPRDSRPVARCHPERPMYAVGLCQHCYAGVIRHRRRTADAQLRGDPLAMAGKRLSAREIEVLDAISRGLSNAEIGTALGRSEQTVKNHMTSILRKLEASDRAQAVFKWGTYSWGVVNEALPDLEYLDAMERNLQGLARDIREVIGRVRKARREAAAPAPATKLTLVDVDGETIVRNQHRDRGDRCRPGGHLFTKANTRISKRGGRQCRACARDKARDLGAAQRAALKALRWSS